VPSGAVAACRVELRAVMRRGSLPTAGREHWQGSRLSWNDRSQCCVLFSGRTNGCLPAWRCRRGDCWQDRLFRRSRCGRGCVSCAGKFLAELCRQFRRSLGFERSSRDYLLALAFFGSSHLIPVRMTLLFLVMRFSSKEQNCMAASALNRG